MSASPITYRPGDTLKAKIPGWAKSYPCTINRVNSDGTYDLIFEDGDQVKSIDASVFVVTEPAVELPPPAPSPTNTRTPSPTNTITQTRQLIQPQPPTVHQRSERTFVAGDRVEARAPGWTSFYKGTIINVHSDGAVDVKFEDGDFKRNLRGIELRDIGRHRDSSKSPQRKGRRQRPSSAKPVPSSSSSSVSSSTTSSTTSTTSRTTFKATRPSSAPRARSTSTMPVGGGLTFAQWKRNSSKGLYSGGSARFSTTKLSNNKNKKPLSKRPTTGRRKKKMPQDLAKYLSTKINPILRNLSERIFLDQPHDLASYMSDFAAEVSAKQYGSCGDVVRRLAGK